MNSYHELVGRTFLIVAGILGLTGVGAGAFGAHGLRGTISSEMLSVWQTAAAYQMWHALALFGVGISMNRSSTDGAAGFRAWTLAGWLFTFGVVAFSGSLYLLVLVGAAWIGIVTPFGGLSMMAGWACVVAAAWPNAKA